VSKRFNSEKRLLNRRLILYSAFFFFSSKVAIQYPRRYARAIATGIKQAKRIAFTNPYLSNRRGKRMVIRPMVIIAVKASQNLLNSLLDIPFQLQSNILLIAQKSRQFGDGWGRT